MPNRGLNYGTLRYVTRNNGFSSDSTAYAVPEIRVAFQGTEFPVSGTPPFATRLEELKLCEEAAPRTHLIDVTGVVRDGKLRFFWTSPNGTHTTETLQRVAESAARFAEAIASEREMARDHQFVRESGFLESNDRISTVIPLRATGSRTPFFCVAPAGGLVFPYFSMLSYIDADQPFYGLQDPSLNSGARPFTTIEELADFHVGTIERMQPNGPYLLGGWSFGGYVALEIARRLAAKGETVAFLAIIDQIVPGNIAWPSGIREWANRIGTFAKLGLRTYALITPYCFEALYLKLSAILWRKKHEGEEFSMRDYMTWAWHDALRQSLFWTSEVKGILGEHSKLEMWQQPTVRRALLNFNLNILAIRKFKPAPYSGHIDVFRTEDFLADVRLHDPESFGWNGLAEKGATVTRVPGNHVELMRKPYVEAIGRALNDRLARVHMELTESQVPVTR
ncbi:MAG: hypothetical protein AMXMBFR84_16220 [Candidatus Hydrogenedentota bacterium]